MSIIKRIFKVALWKQIIIMAILGAALGVLSPAWGLRMQILGDIFIALVKMTIVPLILCMIILGVSKMSSGKDLARVTLKSIVYFEVVTTILLLMSVVLCNVMNIGGKAHFSTSIADAGTVSHFAERSIDFKEFIMHLIPDNVVQSMADQNLLAIIVFGAFFGVGLGALKENGKVFVDVLDAVANTMFKILNYVIKLSPFGVFGFISYAAAQYGASKLINLLDLILVVYAGLAVTVFIIFPIICKIFKVKYIELMSAIKDLIVIAFATRSSEVVLAPMIEKLDEYGVDRSILSFVLPLGYSFNLSGGSVYWPAAIIFVANAFGTPFSIGEQVQLVIVIMLISKGVAGVAGGNFVVLTSICAMFGLPMEGVALIFAVDFITDIARTVVNVIGNAIATLVIAGSERKYSRIAYKAADAEQ